MSPETKDTAFAILIVVAALVVFFIAIRAGLRGDVQADAAASKRTRIRIDPEDNPALLLAAMRAFEGVGHISFHGNDPGSGLRLLAGASQTQANGPRGGIWPRADDFVVVPLTRENIEAISKLIVWEAWETGPWDTNAESDDRVHSSDFIHVQIALGDRCVFGAWDSFHEECVVATDEFPLEVLDRLVAAGTIRSYTVDPYPYRGRYYHAP